MKKIFGISLVAVLMTMPMMANADPVAGDPGATVTTGASVAGSAPKYALKIAEDGDEKAALASYVKGAYNAVIKGVNKTQDEIDTLNTGIETYSDAIGQLTTGKATKDGTVATIKSATTNESIQNSTVNISGVTTSSISATASGNVDLSVPAVADWSSGSLAANPVQTTTTFTGLAVNNLTMSAPTSNTATLTKNGINGNVDVVKYLANAGFDFTPFINNNADSYTPTSYDGSTTWTAKWNSYGTVNGITMCSSDGDGNSKGYTIEGTPSVSGTSNGNKYCWCKMTGFTENDGTVHNDTSLWVFNYKAGTASDCAKDCAFYCGNYVRSRSDMRSGMFSNVQQ